MEMHDIRYLHDDSLPEDDELGKEFILPSFLTKKNVASMGVILVLVVSIGMVIVNIADRTTTQSSASGEEAHDIAPEPTLAEVTLKGKISCLEDKTLEESECKIAITTADGEVYALENVQYEDVASGDLVPGKETSVTGVIVSGSTSSSPGSDSGSGSSTSSSSVTGTVYITNPDKGPGQPSSTPAILPSPTITLTPTPTPLPFSIPTPTVDYLTVKYIVDNKETLSSKNVPLGAYIVSAQQPDPDCPQEEDCSRVQFIVNDATGGNRNLFYDTLLIANTTSEGEILFTTGQNIYATVTVIVVEGEVSLLLNILD